MNRMSAATRNWLAQRLTAGVMIAYSLFVLMLLPWHPVSHFADWQALLRGPFVRLFSLIFLLSLFYHAWLGMRDIFMDYIHSPTARTGLQALVILALLGYTGWAVFIFWTA